MGFDNDCILNIQSLAGEYFCAVCRTLVYPNEAMQAPCTHLYCKPCLTYVVTTTNACAYDGYRVTEAESKPLLESNKTLADTIGKIQVHCLYYRTGCSWLGPLSDCTTHCSTCSFGESAVLCNRCGIQLKHRQVQEHAQTCSGTQSQAQQSGAVVQDSTSTGTTAAPNQTQTAVQNVQTPQTSTAVVPAQDANQTANLTAQPQAAQTNTPTPEQLYQQQQQQYQQQYQQYYQQYPGYDPYQQQYQQYYQQYPGYPQPAQQYPQQQAQAYPQAYGQVQPQQQPQGYGQAQTQPIVQPQQLAQPQVPSQVAQPPLQPQAQPVVNAQPQVPSVGQTQPQPQMQAHGQAPPSHAVPYNQAQPYAQPQPVPQQPTQVPQYPQPQMQAHPQAQPYPQPQTQQYYSHPQPQLQPQSHPPQNMQAPAHPPQQALPPNALLQSPNAVTGYQSYPQAQMPPQAQAGHPGHVAGAQYPNQMQGQFPPQSAQMRPPTYPNVPNQQLAQGQPPSGPPAQQQPAYPHPQQPGYPFQPRPNAQATQQPAPQQYGQQQPFPGQGPYMQNQTSAPTHLHSQGPSQMPPQSQQNYGQTPSGQSNVAPNYTGRPLAAQTAPHPYAQSAGPAGTAQVKPPGPPQLNTNHRINTNSQLSNAEQQPIQSQLLSSGDKSSDPSSQKGVPDQTNPSKENKEPSNGLSASADGNNGKGNFSGSKQSPNEETAAKNLVQETKPLPKAPGDTGKSGVQDPEGVFKKAEVQDSNNTANNSGPPKSHFKSHERNQQQPMAHSMNHPVSSQQPVLPVHPSNQLRPQGQAASGAFPLEHPPGGRHGNMNYYQGNLPPHLAGQHPNILTDPHRPGASRSEIENFPADRSGHLDGKQLDSHPHRPVDPSSFGPNPQGFMPGPEMRDKRGMPFVEEHLKRFPQREFEDDFRKLPRPHLDDGPSNFSTRFPPSGPLDHSSRRFGEDGMLRPFDKDPRGFEPDSAFKMDGVGSGASRLLPPFHPKDGERARGFPDDDMRRADLGRPDFTGLLNGQGFGRHRMDGFPPRSPGADFPGFASRRFGPFGDVGGNDFRKAPLESRFPIHPRGDFDVPGNLRLGEHLGQNQDLMLSHLRRGGHPGELSRKGPPFSGNFPPHIQFDDPFSGEKSGFPLVGEPGFRSQYGFPHRAHDGPLHSGEVKSFDNPRMRTPGSIRCRICKIECRTVENLDLHSQTGDHQLKARDMVLSIKQQNKKRKVPSDQAFVDEGRVGGRPRGFQGRGNKR